MQPLLTLAEIDGMDSTMLAEPMPASRVAPLSVDVAIANAEAALQAHRVIFRAHHNCQPVAGQAARQQALVCERRLSAITATAQRSAQTWAATPGITRADLAIKALRDENTLLQDVVRDLHDHLCASTDQQEADARKMLMATQPIADDAGFFAAWEAEEPAKALQWRGAKHLIARVTAWTHRPLRIGLRILALPFRALAALIALCITLLDLMLKLVIFFALLFLSAMPDPPAADPEQTAEWPLLPIAIAFVGAAAFVATNFWPWGFLK